MVAPAQWQHFPDSGYRTQELDHSQKKDPHRRDERKLKNK